MLHRIWIDEKTGILHMQLVDEVSIPEINTLLDSATDLLKGMEKRLLCVDLSFHHKIINKDIRKIINRRLHELQVSKYAFVGASASTRMTARVVMTAAGQAKTTGFFSSNNEAITWLKES